jgi:N-acetylglutamate synthase
MNVKAIEELSMNAIPAESTSFYDGWVILMSRRGEARIRAVNPLYGSNIDIGRKVEFCEEAYGRKGMPCSFLVSSESEPGCLDSVLQRLGYEKLGEHIVMAAKVPKIRLESIRGGKPDPARQLWRRIYGELCPDPEMTFTASRIRGGGMAQKVFAFRPAVQGAAGLGIGLVLNACLEVFDLVGREELKPDLLGELFAKAGLLGAEHAFARVPAGDKAAQALLEASGFSPLYPYWFRTKVRSDQAAAKRSARPSARALSLATIRIA